jgi:hypothetical protein
MNEGDASTLGSYKDNGNFHSTQDNDDAEDGKAVFL